MIDGRTQLVGLIGWPVEHSLSPAMHNAAFDALGLNWCYVPLPVPPGQVAEAVRGIAALGFRGVNVTMPHKQAVLPFLDEIDPAASRIGAVNTITIMRDAEGRATLTGYNTDYQGFIRALRKSGFDPAGRRAVIVGAGGAARAATFALLEAGAADILVLGNTPQRLQALFAALDTGEGRLRILQATPQILVEEARAADLLVNATPVGMWQDKDEHGFHREGTIWPEDVPLPSHLTVLDMVYAPPKTRLLRQAWAAGAHAIGGLEMLVEQGAAAFELWVGKPAPVAVMRAACEQALRR